MKNRNLVLCLLASILMAQWSCAFPIPPRSLRQLYNDAELIVVANVQKTEAVELDDLWSRSKATLKVSSCLKGEVKGSTVAVYYAPNMVCPSPARYKTGKTVLAFLKAREKGEGYRTYALSYGAKALAEGELEIYLARMKELKIILVIQDEQERFRKTTAWLVTCVEKQVTRMEGLLDLDGPSRYYSTKETEPGPQFVKYLDKDQKTRLVAILQSAEPGRYEMPYELLTVMSILSKTADDRELRHIVERYRKIDWKDQKKQEKQRALIAEFLMKWKGAARLRRDAGVPRTHGLPPWQPECVMLCRQQLDRRVVGS